MTRIVRSIVVALLFGAAVASAQQPGYLPPPLLGPPRVNAYGPGMNSDATGRPFRSRTLDTGEPLTVEPPPKPNGYGLGVDQDVYGRPVGAEPE